MWYHREKLPSPQEKTKRGQKNIKKFKKTLNFSIFTGAAA